MERAQQERLRLVNGAAPQVHLRHRTGARFISLTPDSPVPPPRGDPFSEQTCSRRRSIAATAPVSLADTAKAGVHVKPLPDGGIVIFRESPQQRLKRLKTLFEIYKHCGPEVELTITHMWAEQLEAQTRVAAHLASSRIRALLRRKQLLARAKLPLSWTTNFGVAPKTKDNRRNHACEIAFQKLTTAIISRAPPSVNIIALCQGLVLVVFSFWLGFACPRALRAPTRAARCERVAWVK